MFSKFKSVRPILFSLASVSLIGCGGGSGSSINADNSVVDESGQMPNIGEANAGNPDALTANLAPEINSISLGCDLVTESVAIKIGETTTFTLDVTDESQSTLIYAVSTDDPLVLESAIDNNGMVSLSGLSQGKTVVPVSVTDESGLTHQIFIDVLVDV